MSDTYTPSTDQIRRDYSTRDSSEWTEAYRILFDRWLAARDAEVRAEEREMCAQAIIQGMRRDKTQETQTRDWHHGRDAGYRGAAWVVRAGGRDE